MATEPRRYKFTLDYPLIFTDLTLGANLSVVRAVPTVDHAGAEIEAPAGSTLLAQPGDILVVAGELPVLAYASLIEIDKKGNAVVVATQSAADALSAESLAAQAADLAKAETAAAETAAAAVAASADPTAPPTTNEGTK